MAAVLAQEPQGANQLCPGLGMPPDTTFTVCGWLDLEDASQKVIVRGDNERPMLHFMLQSDEDRTQMQLLLGLDWDSLRVSVSPFEAAKASIFGIRNQPFGDLERRGQGWVVMVKDTAILKLDVVSSGEMVRVISMDGQVVATGRSTSAEEIVVEVAQGADKALLLLAMVHVLHSARRTLTMSG